MGNYVTHTEITNWPTEMTITQKEAVIAEKEELVERITRDYFYSKSFEIVRSGNGGDRLYLGLTPFILSISELKINGEVIPPEMYSHDGESIFAVHSPDSHIQFNGAPLFPYSTAGGNVEVKGTYGHANVPVNIKKAVKILIEQENNPALYHKNIFQSERLGDYSYTRANNNTLTGIAEVDDILNLYVRRGMGI